MVISPLNVRLAKKHFQTCESSKKYNLLGPYLGKLLEEMLPQNERVNQKNMKVHLGKKGIYLTKEAE